MELLINAKDINLQFSGRDILSIEQLNIYEYDRIALIGLNGAGKSTLLKILIGEIEIPECKINRLGTMSYIPQFDEHVLHNCNDFSIYSKLGISKIAEENMSGGQETRLKIANALSTQVNAILADEPTSHLDREGINFLIQQFKYFAGAVLVISHDRYFLDQTVNKIWELKDGKITEYWGNYSDYLIQKEQERKSQENNYQMYVKERNRLVDAAKEKRKQAEKIEKKANKNSKNKSKEAGGRLSHQKTIGTKQKKMHNAAKAIEHKLANLEEMKAPENIQTIQFRQSKVLELHNPYPIMASDIGKKIGDKVLFDKVSFSIPQGKKIALVGDNGSGKTTLMKMIFNHEEGISISPKAKIGYFDQNGYKYNGDSNIIEFMQQDCDYNISEIRCVLATMGFCQKDIIKKLSVLSGGEIMKLLLAKLLMGKYNILLLDEPSNFLDIKSLVALEKLMKDYTGTIIFVSHDQTLVQNVADIIYEINNKSLNRVK
ncbi:MAG: Msr family ABC-F type ribosomal protection protein [Turicibacter sp.]